MAISEILILIALSLVLGWVTRKGYRRPLILVASVLAVYWLQPEMPLRYLNFWFPTATLLITVFSWVVTAAQGERIKSKNLKTFLLVITIIFLWGLVGSVEAVDVISSIQIPNLLRIVIVLFISFTIFLLQYRFLESSQGSLWTVFLALILFFVFLKTPYLTRVVSALWRNYVGQTPDLASAADVRWLGFSYLAFRLLHTIRDRQLGRLPDLDLDEYFIFIIFYPAFTAGPIARIQNFREELREVKGTFREDVIAGGERLVVGLFKKFVIADTLAMIALDNLSVVQVESQIGAWVLLYAYSLQIFFDFSGYTDIAIGLGRMMNIRLPENFNRPYLQPNLTQFWNSWHITLTQWFRTYFFYPLSRSLRRKKSYPLFLVLLVTQVSTMVLVGVWHGVMVSFVLWGVWHGIGLFVQNRWAAFYKEKISQLHPIFEAEPFLKTFGVFLTFHYVSLGWVWFVIRDPVASWKFLLRLMGLA